MAPPIVSISLLDLDEITLPTSADLHVHLRDGPMMEAVVPTIRQGGVDTVFVMPNLTPPITTPSQAVNYLQNLQSIDPTITYLMSLYLHPSISPSIIPSLPPSIRGIKSYPFGVTTNSSSGVISYEPFYPVFAAMQSSGLVLNLHGERPSASHSQSSDAITVLSAESAFLPTLHNLHRLFPDLRIVLEHCTTAAAIDAVLQCGPNVVGTITPHHMLMTIDDWVGDPYSFCKPVAKLPTDRQALLRAAMGLDFTLINAKDQRETIGSATGKFFLGSDSAPHLREAKCPPPPPSAADGCCSGEIKTAAGCFTQMNVTQLVLEALEQGVERGDIRRDEIKTRAIEAFVSSNGRAFYNLPSDVGTRKYVKGKGNKVRQRLPVGADAAEKWVVPFWAGRELRWHLVEETSSPLEM